MLIYNDKHNLICFVLNSSSKKTIASYAVDILEVLMQLSMYFPTSTLRPGRSTYSIGN